MGLNATVRKLLTRNPGSSAIDAARVRNSAQVSPTDVANSITSVQRQIDAVVTVALADQTVSDPITVSGEDGGQIGWIGTVVQNTVSYLGMWFQNFWLGGTSPATAQIYSDSLGDVFIDGAEIVNTPFELNLNGVTTSIENLNSAVGVLSIKSLDNATSYYSGATPTGFELLDNLGNSLGSLRSSGASGHLDLSNVAGTNTVNLITGGGGAPKLSIASAAGTVSMSPGTPLSVFGNTVIDSSRNGSFASVTASTGDVNITSGLLALNGTTRITNAGNAAFAQLAVDLKVTAVTGTSGGTGVGNAMLSATTAGLFLSLNGAAPVALGAGGGTVTSVALTAPAQFAVTGTPITSAGTLAIAWNNQTANTVLAGPASGGAAAPTFRALVAADVAGLATPGGSTTQVQYNNAGAFAGAANFAWANATNILTVGPANTAGTGYVGTLFNSSATGTTAAFQTSAGTFSITGAGNAAFQQVALALKATAVTGTSGGVGIGNAMLSATTTGLFLSLNGAAPVACLTTSSLTAGTGISIAGGTTITNTGIINLTAGTGISVAGSTITNTGIISLTAGTGISVAGSTITNTGIISLTAGTGISVAGSTITNTGVLNYSPGIKVAAFSGTSGALATFSDGIYVYDSAGNYKGMIPLT